MQKIYAFIKKEFITEISYKFSFLLHVFGTFSWLLIFFFIDKLFGSRVEPHLEQFGVNYFSYVLLGIAFSAYVGTGIGNFATKIRNEQLMGTLEALLATPTRIATIVLSMYLWGFIWASVSVVTYLAFGSLLFGVDLSNANILSSLVILVLTILSFSGLGLLAAGFIMILKRGQPVTWVVNTVFELLGGVYFPVAVLPLWLKAVSRFIPVTYAIQAIELAVYKGYAISALASEISALAIFACILMPLGLAFFSFAVNRARLSGSLTHY